MGASRREGSWPGPAAGPLRGGRHRHRAEGQQGAGLVGSALGESGLEEPTSPERSQGTRLSPNPQTRAGSLCLPTLPRLPPK